MKTAFLWSILLVTLLVSAFLVCEGLAAKQQRAPSGDGGDGADTEPIGDGDDNGGDGDDNGDGDDDAPSSREIEVKVDKDTVKVEGSGAADRSEIEFEMDLKNGGSDLFEARYEWKNDHRSISVNGTQRKRQEIEFRFRISNIVEYVESGDNQGFQLGEDTIKSTYGSDDIGSGKHDNVDWNEWTQLADTPTAAGVVKSYEAKTSDGVFYVKGYVGTADISVNALSLTPNLIKIDIGIFGYDFQDDSSSLALMARVRASSSSFSQDDDHHGKQVSIDASQANIVAAVLGWAPTVDVDGKTVDVVVAPLAKESGKRDDDEEFLLVFSFPKHGQDYLWDPTMGVDYKSSSSDSASAALAPFWQSLLL